MATRPVTFVWFAAAALAAGVASSAALAGNWELFGPSDARFVALGGTPKFDGLVFGYTIATTGGGKALQPYVSLDNGQRWRRTPPIDVDPSPRTYSTALGGGTTPVLYLEAADRLFRSDDQGVTWKPVVSGGTPGLVGVNPLDGLDVYAVIDGVLQHSLDGGASWAAVGPAGVNVAAVDWYARVAHLAFTNGQLQSINLQNGAVINTVTIANATVAADGNLAFAMNPGNLYRSTDGGRTWGFALLEVGQFNAAGVAFQSGGSGFAYVWEAPGGGRRLWRTADRGNSWTLVGTPPCACQWTSIVVSSLDANVFVAATTGGTYLSGDGGLTFEPLPTLLGAPGGPALGVLSDAGDKVRKWIVSARGPLPPLYTEDTGGTWLPLPKAPDDDVPRPVFIHPDFPGLVIAQGNVYAQGTAVWRSMDAGFTWKSELALGGPLGASIAAAVVGNIPTDLLLLGRVEGETGASSVAYFSDDAGGIWSGRAAPPLAVRAGVRTGAGVLAGGDAVGDGSSLVRSVNFGASWTPLALPVDATVTSLAVARSNGNRVYAGTDAGGANAVLASSDGGLTWASASRSLGSGPVTAIAVHPLQPNHVVISQRGDGVFRTLDGGASWQALDAGLQSVAVESVSFDAKDPRYLYAATEAGVFRTDLDSGAPVGYTRAYEFYYAPFDHYFSTSDPVEIDGLDRGIIAGWTRTGAYTRVEPPSPLPRRPVCRFFGTGFAPKSSHFYTPYPDECELVKQDPRWVYENIAFGWRLPDANGACDVGYRPLYRLYNNFVGGAPNHRYTTSLRDFYAMLAQGWVFEGDARSLVFGCLPN